MLMLNEEKIKAAVNHPEYQLLKKVAESRAAWPAASMLANAGSSAKTLVLMAQLKSLHSRSESSVIAQCIKKMREDWKNSPIRDVCRWHVMDLCDAMAIYPELADNDDLQQLLQGFILQKSRGLSPGAALWARVLALETAGATAAARECALNGFDDPTGGRHPGLEEFFGSDRWLFKSGPAKFNTLKYVMQTTWGYMLDLFNEYGGELSNNREAYQRKVNFERLPIVTLMSDGMYPVYGDDYRKNGQGPELATGFYHPDPSVCVGAGHDQKWLRQKARQLMGGPSRLRDLIHHVEGVFPLWPSSIGVNVSLRDDTGGLLFSKTFYSATWHRDPATSVWGAGHSSDHPFPITSTRTATGRVVTVGE